MRTSLLSLSPFRYVAQYSILTTPLLSRLQFVQVDIDQALSGIDKLLKSQELTFAFVGVAPAFGIVYAAGGAVHRLWSGSTGRGRYGGKRRRVRVWLAMRYAQTIAHLRSYLDHDHASVFHAHPMMTIYLENLISHNRILSVRCTVC